MLQKYFIAIVPPEPLLSEIRSIKQQIADSYGTKGALRSPAHITLHMPFSWEEAKENRLIETFSACFSGTPFTLRLHDYDCFEPRVVFIGIENSEPLVALQQAVVRRARQNLQLFNQSDDRRGFHPHVTVAFRDLKKAVFYRLWDYYQHQLFQAAFECQSFCLLKHNGNSWEVFQEFRFKAE